MELRTSIDSGDKLEMDKLPVTNFDTLQEFEKILAVNEPLKKIMVSKPE